MVQAGFTRWAYGDARDLISSKKSSSTHSPAGSVGMTRDAPGDYRCKSSGGICVKGAVAIPEVSPSSTLACTGGGGSCPQANTECSMSAGIPRCGV